MTQPAIFCQFLVKSYQYLVVICLTLHYNKVLAPRLHALLTNSQIVANLFTNRLSYRHEIVT